MSSRQLQFGAMPASPASGLSSSFEWWSNPFLLDETDALSLTLNPLAETPVAMLVVPSATGKGNNGLPSGMGILYVAQAAGVAGNNITVAHSAPSGAIPAGTPLTGQPIGTPQGAPPAMTPGANPYSLSALAVTAAPWIGATNGQMAMLANQKSTVQAVVQAYPYGWGAVGLPFNSLNSLLQQAALNDLLVTAASANLAGGAATAAITGVATLEVSDDLIGWAPYASGPNDVTSGALVTGSPLQLHVDACPSGMGRLHWVPNLGSVGQISGLLTLKGGSR